MKKYDLSDCMDPKGSPFVLAAHQWIQAPGLDDRVAQALLFLAEAAVGHQHATPIAVVVKHLKAMGIKVDGRWIQHQIVVRSRRTQAFIGSCNDGLFLMAEPGDGRVMDGWYDNRMTAEGRNRCTLRTLTAKANWDIDDPQMLFPI